LLVDKLLLQQKEECSPAEVSNSMAFFNSPNSMLCRQVGRTIIAIDMSQQKLNTFNIHVIQMNSLITELEKCREIRSFLVRSHQTQSPPAVVQITVRNTEASWQLLLITTSWFNLLFPVCQSWDPCCSSPFLIRPRAREKDYQ
jgi:hypothetical protein